MKRRLSNVEPLLTAGLAAAALLALMVVPALAADAPPVPNKGDTAWMLVATALVLMMSIPGLALFYGGLVRTKNMLSVLTQVFMIVSMVGIVWVTYGYSIALGDNAGPYPGLIGSFGKVFLRGVTPSLHTWPRGR